MEDKGKAEREALLEHLHGLTTESTAAKLENQSLKVKQLANTESFNSLYSDTTFVDCCLDVSQIRIYTYLLVFCVMDNVFTIAIFHSNGLTLTYITLGGWIVNLI